jgi:DNA-binding CsgD family transcriptional regulator
MSLKEKDLLLTKQGLRSQENAAIEDINS